MEARVRCPSCGADSPKGARFCPDCGAALGAARPRMATGLLPTRYLLNNRYAVTRKIAHGGQSAVYLAHDTYQNDAERAIKEMSESQIEPEKRQQAINDFMREAHMLQTLNHPSLAQVYDLFIEQNKYYLVMEYVVGHNLEDELVQYRREALDWEDVTVWGMALADTLSYLHTRNPPIIYRDLKPANVMLLPDGSVKLIDFGIARWLHPMRMNDTMQLGTDGYAPLEQYSSRSEPRSDIYALGASLYHLLTGRVPEAAPLRMAGHSLRPIREANPRVPEVVEQAILKSLALHPQDRYRNAQEMREGLEWARRQSQSRTTGGIARTMTSGPTSSGTFRTGAPAYQPGREQLSQHPSYPPPANHPVTPHPAPTNHAPTPHPAPTGGSRANASAAPRLYVWPLRMDAGYILVNQTSVHRLEIANKGGGALTGRAVTNIGAMTVEPTRFDESVEALEVRIDATNLAVGPYVAHIALRTNGGDQIVQVRFVVRPTDEIIGGRTRRTSY